MKELQQLLHTVRLWLCLGLLLLCALPSRAQDAAAVATNWKGVDQSTLLDQDKTFYLYNVGTGRFVKASGDWGTQSMLRFQDYGEQFKLKTETACGQNCTVLYTGFATAWGGTDGCMGINYPHVTNNNAWTDRTKTFFVLMDMGNGKNTAGNTYFARSMTLERVSGTASDVYVYRLKEKLANYLNYNSFTHTGTDKEFYIGARYGVYSATVPSTDAQPADNTDSGNDQLVTFSATDHSADAYAKNFMWQLISGDELAQVVDASSIDQYGGLNANISYLIRDGYFDRHVDEDFADWQRIDETTSSSETGKLYRWKTMTGDDAAVWDDPVMNKTYVDTKEGGQYSYGSMNGKEEIFQTFTAPKTGTYGINARGLWQGPDDPDTHESHEAYLYIGVQHKQECNFQGETDQNGWASKTKALYHVPDNTYVKLAKKSVTENGVTYQKWALNESAEDGALALGKELYDNPEGKYSVRAFVFAHQGDEVRVGVSKRHATKSAAISATGTDWVSGTEYFYDTDIVAVDNFNVREINDPFIEFDEENTDEQQVRAMSVENGTLLLKRTFSLGKWNTLMMPVSLTVAQVRQAFGDGVRVATLDGVGTQSGMRSCIDFSEVNIGGEGTVIEAGKLYLVMPTIQPSYMDFTYFTHDTSEEKTVQGNYYLLGRRTFDGSTLTAGTHVTYSTDAYHEMGNVLFHGTYVKMAAEEGDATKGCPAGAYVFSDGDMYHLASPKTIRGFRGWITDESGQQALQAKIHLLTGEDEVYGQPTSIGTLQSVEEAGPHDVYNLQGQMVRRAATTLQGLPAGLYIMGGKKIMVK